MSDWGSANWRDFHPEAKSEGGILISHGRGFGSDRDMETFLFCRGNERVLLGYSQGTNGWELHIQSEGELLKEISGVLKDPAMLEGLVPIDIAGIIDCPKGEPMHYHHDGCPALCCKFIQLWETPKDEIL